MKFLLFCLCVFFTAATILIFLAVIEDMATEIMPDTYNHRLGYNRMIQGNLGIF